VAEERDFLAVGLQDEGRADGLLAEVVVHDPLLDPAHDRVAEELHDRRVDPCGHQPEGVARRVEAVVRLQVLEPAR